MKRVELLSPAGDLEKLRSALHFGADAVYLAGKNFGLRSFAGNFTDEELLQAIKEVHSLGKKVYVAVNIFASNADFGRLSEYIDFLSRVRPDGLIVSDPGIIDFVRKRSDLDIHLSTQANTTNKYAAAFWRDCGVKRIVLARETSLKDIAETVEYLSGSAELEVFIHGAMCISYSGRCLISTYLTDRDSNRGECVQACRWEYLLTEKSRKGSPLTLEEDERGSYVLNSKDLNTMPFVDKIIEAGVASLKIEGRMKSPYYVGSVTNAYRKRIDDYYEGKPYDASLNEELFKVNHREYTSGFFFGKAEQCLETSKPFNDYAFAAKVLSYDGVKKEIFVEMRNRFRKGDVLETVSVNGSYNLTVEKIVTERGESIEDCKIVQQKVYLPCPFPLQADDMLRIKLK